MGGTDCGEYRIGLGVYALGRLAGTEAAELREHLDGCGPCRTELAELRGVADLLARSVAPPAGGASARAPGPPPGQEPGQIPARTRKGAGQRARMRPAGASSRLLSGACAAASRPPGR